MRVNLADLRIIRSDEPIRCRCCDTYITATEPPTPIATPVDLPIEYAQIIGVLDRERIHNRTLANNLRIVAFDSDTGLARLAFDQFNYFDGIARELQKRIALLERLGEQRLISHRIGAHVNTANQYGEGTLAEKKKYQ